MIGFDPMYFAFLAPAMLLAFFAQWKVKSAYAKASQIRSQSGRTGMEVTRLILERNGLRNVGIEVIPGQLSDHYDSAKKMLRLSPDVAHGNSIASLGIAAHEAGHALQDATGYSPLVIRNGIVPLANIGSSVSFLLMFLGAMINAANLVVLGIAAFSLVVIFQLINLPVEFNASTRAKEVLVATGMISESERREVEKVLNAAAMTYVAATITALLTLVYYLFRFGLLGQRSDD